MAEVIAVAKRDLAAGEVLTGSGGGEITGQIDRHEVCRREDLLPLGLSYQVKLQRDVAQGSPLTLEDVEPDEESLVYQLWRLQNATFA